MRAPLAALLAALLVLASGGAALADGPVATAEIDRDTITVGDRILLTITVDLPPGYDLVDPGVQRTVGELEIVQILSVFASRLVDGGSRLELRYLVTTFEVGDHAVPQLALGYADPDRERGIVLTQGRLPIRVVSVIAPGEDDTQIKPLKPPLPLPAAGAPALDRLVPAVAAAVALLAAAALVLRLRRRRPLLAGAALTPAQRALVELERVAGLALADQGRMREHYDLLSSALRRYAAERFAIPAEARTARELRLELERAGLGRAQATLLYEVLRDAETVRFEELVIYPARAHKSMRDVVDALRKAAVAEEYELARGAT